MPSQAGWGGAQIRATVPIKLRQGQVVKHHMLWVTRPKPIILEPLCGLKMNLGVDQKGGENRESENSLTHDSAGINEKRRDRGHIRLSQLPCLNSKIA